MNHRQAARNRKTKRLSFVRPRLEELESRLTPTAILSLDIVALHEIGHALGLRHIDPGPSIMQSSYDANYDAEFLLSGEDPAFGQLRALYSSANIQAGRAPWSDAKDAIPGNNVIDLTYSFSASFIAVMNAKLGADNWQQIFARVADIWSSVSGGTLSITPADENNIMPSANIYSTASRMDGPGGVLARTSEPPSSKVEFDAAEPWGGIILTKFTDDLVFGSDALTGPVSNLPRDFIAMVEAGHVIQAVPVLDDVQPMPVIQFQLDVSATSLPPALTSVAALGWGQHSQADLYKMVFLPILPIESQEEEIEMPDMLVPQPPANENSFDVSAPVQNDVSVQTQTLQLPSVNLDSSTNEERTETAGLETVFDGGTALAGLALVMGGYWVVPQEEGRKKFFN